MIVVICIFLSNQVKYDHGITQADRELWEVSVFGKTFSKLFDIALKLVIILFFGIESKI